METEKWKSVTVKKMMAAWAYLHPSRWTTNEVSDWMAFVAKRHGIDDETSARHVTVFEDVRGDKLCNMSREDFQSLEPCFGGLYFDVFRKIFHECIPPSDVMTSAAQHDCKPESRTIQGCQTWQEPANIQPRHCYSENDSQPKSESTENLP
ncbi:uncharacterized protein LOC135466501 [Liolophura sinensis]|uniref:uncharacterized protein LOC135466501 n=1 Tax=Liolophura sinensis TaxID=3198878 RepID=UPI0031580104